MSATRKHGHAQTGPSRRNGYGSHSSGHSTTTPDLDATLDVLETIDRRLEEAFVELAREPDIKRRRALAKTLIAPLGRELELGLNRSAEALDPATRHLTAPYRSALMGQFIARTMSLLRFWQQQS